MIAWRLESTAPGHEGGQWYPAKDKQQLESNLKRVVVALAKADQQFQQFGSFSDVVEEYRRQSRLPLSPTGKIESFNTYGVMDYGLLLMLDNGNEDAIRWLHRARELLEPIMESDKKLMKFKKYDGFTKANQLRMSVLDSALARLETAKGTF